MKWKNLNAKYKSRLEELRSLSPHELLEVDEKASIAAIKSAYKKKVRTYHPDRTDPFMSEYGEEVLILLNSAFQTIINQSKKNGS